MILNSGRGIPRQVRRRPQDTLRRVQPQVRRPKGQARRRVMCYVCMCNPADW